jgi:hypothetical protein
MGHCGGGAACNRCSPWLRHRARKIAFRQSQPQQSQPMKITPLAIHEDRLVKTTLEHAEVPHPVLRATLRGGPAKYQRQNSARYFFVSPTGRRDGPSSKRHGLFLRARSTAASLSTLGRLFDGRGSEGSELSSGACACGARLLIHPSMPIDSFLWQNLKFA